MKTVLVALAILAVGLGLAYAYKEFTSSQHSDLLEPVISAVESGKGFAVFRVVHYEPNMGVARAYAVLSNWDRKGRETHVGRYYHLKSPNHTEQWRVDRTEDLWDEAKGDRPPWLVPYWRMN